jgi:hypothetical protein
MRQPTTTVDNVTHVAGLHLSSLALIAGLALLTFFTHYPGQVSVDAILQLQDGLSGVYDSNQPPPMSWLMALLSLPGVLGLNIMFFSLAVAVLLSQLSTRLLWQQNTAVVLLFCFPVLLIYNGIVWKDVVFANGALLGLLLLPRGRDRPNWRSLVASATVLALAVSVRQQGVLAAAFAIAYLLLAPVLFTVRSDRWKALGLWLIVYVALGSLIDISVAARGDLSKSSSLDGPLFQLRTFDLGGIAAVNPDIEFPSLEASADEAPARHQPTRERVIAALSGYSPDRHDWMGETIAKAGIFFPKKALYEDWRTRILEHPLDYVTHRLDFLSWLFGFHNIYQCLPFIAGISAEPSDMVKEIGIEPGMSWRAEQVEVLGLTTVFLFRPYFYLAISALVIVVIFYRGWRQHMNMILIQLTGLSYAGSYAIVGIACDFRYTFLSTVVSLFGLIYVMLNCAPPRAIDDLPE